MSRAFATPVQQRLESENNNKLPLRKENSTELDTSGFLSERSPDNRPQRQSKK
jgi:hypothetical protein